MKLIQLSLSQKFMSHSKIKAHFNKSYCRGSDSNRALNVLTVWCRIFEWNPVPSFYIEALQDLLKKNFHCQNKYSCIYVEGGTQIPAKSWKWTKKRPQGRRATQLLDVTENKRSESQLDRSIIDSYMLRSSVWFVWFSCTYVGSARDPPVSCLPQSSWSPQAKLPCLFISSRMDSAKASAVRSWEHWLCGRTPS